MPSVGETEFGGDDGIIMQRNIDSGILEPHEQLMTIYATNPGNPESTDDVERKSTELDPERVGKPESYQDGIGWDSE